MSEHTPHAVVCAWCGEPITPEDWELVENGAPVSHGVCEECNAEQFPEEEKN